MLSWYDFFLYLHASPTRRSSDLVAAVLSVTLLTKTAELRYQRDVNRMVYNDNLGVLDEVKASLGMTGDSLKRLMSDTPDRKSTRLNSSHLVISYAVFCLKKKTRK